NPGLNTTSDCCHMSTPTDISAPATPRGMLLRLSPPAPATNPEIASRSSSSSMTEAAATQTRIGMTETLAQTRSSAANQSTTGTLHSTATTGSDGLVEVGNRLTGDENQSSSADTRAAYVCAHEPEPVEEGPNQYRCTHPHCGKVITGRWNAEIHRSEAHDSHPHLFMCTPCGKGYKRVTDLRRHLKTSKAHSNNPEFSCKRCNCRYQRKSELVRHWRENNHGPDN
ncbi:hypothetical protein HK405_014440, partial [Cladochytrium tenue]